MKKYIMLTICCFVGLTTAAFTPQMPGQNPFDTPSLGMPAGQMSMPSPDDFAALNQYLEDLQQNDPEQLKELERMGNELIASLSDKELEEFSSMFGVDPQELRKEAESFLSQETTPEEKPEERPQEQIERKTTTKKEQEAQKQTAKATAKDAQAAQNAIRTTIKIIEELRAKSTSTPSIQAYLRNYDDDLVLLIFYLKLIDNKEHAQRLPLQDDGKIIKTLTKLHEKIQPLVSLIDSKIEARIPNEFAFFDFTKAPSPQELKAAYTKKRAEHDPKKIEEKLTKEGKPSQVIQQEIKAARIAQIAIDEEYERLSDPKNIAEINRKEERSKKEIQDAIKNREILLSKVSKELISAFFDDRLILQLEEYLKTYEPEQLKRKKAQEKAIKEQEQEQKKRAKAAPAKTAASKAEPTLSYGRIPRPRSGGRSVGYPGGYTPSSSPSGTFSDFAPTRTRGDSGSSYGGATGGGTREAPTSVQEDPSLTTKSSTLAEAAKAEGEKLIKKDLKTSMQEFTKNYNEITSLLGSATTNITDATPDKDRLTKLKELATQDKAPQIIMMSDRLVREAERIVSLAKKDKQLTTELKKFFANQAAAEEKFSLLLPKDKEAREKAIKENPTIKTIAENFQKLKETLEPYQEKTEQKN